MKSRIIFLILLTLFGSKHFSSAQDFLDTTFDPGTGANGFVESVVVQPDGKILICGNFTAFNGVPRNYMARLNPNGSLDTTFVATPNYWVRYMALQPDGKIVIGGFFTSVGGLPRARVGRVNADGSVDTTFNPGAGCEGRIVDEDPTSPFIFALGIQPDGKIIIGGNFTNYNKLDRRGVARLNSDGSLDTGFTVGTGTDSWVRSILVLPNQQILLSGWFQNYNSRGKDRMVRLNSDGTADETFRTRIGYSTSIYTMALQADGKVVVGGHSVNTNSLFQQEVVRLNLDGTYDETFNPGGEGANEKVESVVFQSDGKILIGGYFSLYNGTRVKNLARLNSDGTLDTSFNVATDNWIWTIATQNHNKFLIVGAFTTVNGTPRNRVARLNYTQNPPIIEEPPVSQNTNTFLVWHLNGTNFVDAAGIPDHPVMDVSWQRVAFGDANGDGTGDSIFHHTNGQIAAWIVTNSVFTGFKILHKRVKLWQVIGGLNDVIPKKRMEMLSSRPDGRLAVLRFQKGKSKGAGVLSKKIIVNPTWKFVGFNDFNADKKMDMLWQDNVGQLVVWFMRGANIRSSMTLNPAQPLSPEWRAVALNDLTGDQRKDILFQNQNGNLALWSMNGTNVIGSDQLFADQAVGTNWSVVGVNDMNGDGQKDLIWQTK